MPKGNWKTQNSKKNTNTKYKVLNTKYKTKSDGSSDFQKGCLLATWVGCTKYKCQIKIHRIKKKKIENYKTQGDGSSDLRKAACSLGWLHKIAIPNTK